jgi:VanZ family protein
MPTTVSEANRDSPHALARPLLRGLCLTLVAAIVFALFYLGAQPVAVGLFAAPWDKLAHFAVFSAVTALLWIATAGRMPLAVIAAVVAVGALDELHQAGLPGRFADAADFLVDICAAAATSGAISLYAIRHTTRAL